MKIIGISGKSGSGKDFLARQVLAEHGYKKLSFAWALKQDALEAKVGTTEEIFVTKPPKVRRWLQDHGAMWRGVNQQHWVDKLEALMLTLHADRGEDMFAITDVRFLNEVAFVRKYGGKMVRMEFGKGRIYLLENTKAAEHPSENSLDKFYGFDCTIQNHRLTTPYMMEDDLYRSIILGGQLGKGSGRREQADDAAFKRAAWLPESPVFRRVAHVPKDSEHEEHDGGRKDNPSDKGVRPAKETPDRS